MTEYNRHIFSIAPMLDWTDRHCRYLLRQISQHTLLYTEMVTTGAILHGNRERFLGFDHREHPVALQLGGSEPRTLAECSRIGEQAGYDEINLNVGCPSDRVQSGRFGACLMAEPALVADCIGAMKAAVSVPVTVKTRIGIDNRDSYDELAHFIACVRQAGCETFIIHARKAYLQGLSPKENRTVPPLNYDYAYRLKRQYPDLNIVINGGITDLDAAERHLLKVDGVMLGRSAYHNPYLLAEVDRRLFQDQHPVPTREEVVERMLPYIERELKRGSPLKHITRHMLGLFQGVPGARHWRRHLSEHGPRKGVGIEVVTQARQQMLTAAYGLTTTSAGCQIYG
ncbi:MAG: tRNA dihydrouridine(20/20a) synthase DusA [Gammaproteobacteria bacterium]|nr:tRNA dihydrouridine(20/20a) synthase DusA [Gammaproteobacteria bacterium]